MGDQRRVDSDKAKKSDDDVAKQKSRETDDAAFDASHASTAHAYQTKTTESPFIPARMVEAADGAGDYEVKQRYDAAVTAKDAVKLVATVREMSTEGRKAVVDDLETLSGFVPARDMLLVADLVQASVDQTLAAALRAKPALDLVALRGYLSSTPLFRSELDDKTVALLRPFAKSPLELVSAFDDLFGSAALLEWFFEVTDKKVVARHMLSITGYDQVLRRTNGLNKLGDDGWKWLDDVDATIAANSAKNALEWFKYASGALKKVPEEGDPANDVDGHLTKIDSLVGTYKKAEVKPGTEKATAAALRRNKADVVAKSVMEIVEETRHAGFTAAEQLDWVLDKPKLAAAELREATLAIGTVSISDAGAAKLVKLFPKTPINELFGEVPQDLVSFATSHEAIAKWMLQGAPPEQILDIVAVYPGYIAQWCALLVKTGIGFGWVQQLGGQWNDQAMRRFALGCTDAPTVKYIESRILGDGNFGMPTVDKGAAAPTGAYTTGKSHFDEDLAKLDKKESKTAARIDADLGELDAKDQKAVAGDAKKRAEILASANKQTFPHVLSRVDATLPEVLAVATPDTITASFLIAFAQNRSAAEVSTVLESNKLCARFRAIVTSFGLLEVLPAAGSSAVIGPALEKYPALVDWLLDSEPSAVLHAVMKPQALDAMVKALRHLDDTTKIEAWPTAEAMGGAAKSVLVQLAARSKGAVKDVLEAKIKTALPPKVEDEERELEKPDADALAIRAADGGSFVDRLEEVLDRNEGETSTLLALCKTSGTHWGELSPKVVTKLMTILEPFSPLVAFPAARLTALVPRPEWHEWLLTTVPAFQVLDVAASFGREAIANTLNDRTEGAKKFLADLPRGRQLDAKQKMTLRRIAELADDVKARQLFEVAFDTPVSTSGGENFSRDELLRIWTLIERIPHAHVDQQSVHKFIAYNDPKAKSGADGFYEKTTRDISLRKGTIDKKEDNEYNREEHAMTEAQAIEALGSQEAFQTFVDQKRLIKQADGTYKFAAHKTDEFSLTVLHEVGHAVDAMLGEKTEFTYGQAGWKRFPVNDFEGWAKDLGGWDSVSASDQKEIGRVWRSWLNGGGKGTAQELVDDNHPLKNGTYQGVGVIELAKDGGLHKYGGSSAGVRRGMVRHSSQEFFSMSAKAYDASPSNYALSAPEEYFAECYAHYYIGFAEGSAKVKGEAVAPWIKKWFDANIDTVGHNPIRNRNF